MASSNGCPKCGSAVNEVAGIFVCSECSTRWTSGAKGKLEPFD